MVEDASRAELPPHMYAEHWSMHSPQDDCEWNSYFFSDISPDQLGDVKRTSSHQLGRFLTLPGRTPVRSFREGEVFQADQEQDGTIVGIDSESLIFNRDQSGIYKRGDWGVVASYERRDGTTGKFLVFYAIKNGKIEERDLKGPRTVVSKVEHVRISSEQARTEYFMRVNRLGIYRNGSPLREGTTNRLAFPRLGKVLRSPHPQRL